MEINFDVVDFNGGQVAVFNKEPQPRAELLSKFLEAIRPNPSSIFEEMEKAQTGNKLPAGYTYNDIDVDIFPDRVVLEELYPASGDEDDAVSTELSLEETKKLVLDWQNSLDKWYKQNPT